MVLVLQYVEVEHQHRRAPTGRLSGQVPRWRDSGRSSTSGPANPVFDTAVGKVAGVHAAYDRHFPRGLAGPGLNGAEIVFNPSATSHGLSAYLSEAVGGGRRSAAWASTGWQIRRASSWLRQTTHKPELLVRDLDIEGT